MTDTAKFQIGDKTVDYPVLTGSVGPDVVDIRKLYGQTGAFTFDPGFMSTASTKIIQDLPGTLVSYGYDRVRFPAPVFIGDTVTVSYEIVERDEATRRTFSTVTCTTQRGTVVAAATHRIHRELAHFSGLSAGV